jgi:hypothetical protein
MKTLLKILTFFWLAFWLYAGVSMLLDTPEQIASDKKFIEMKIKPSVDFVKNFKTINGRLPNYREYYTWHREYYKDYSSDLKQQVDSLIPGFGPNQYIRKLTDAVSNDYDKFKNVDWNKDFAIGVWRGEWSEYYFSWTDSYDSNNYSWLDGFIGLASMTGIGIFPLIFWWLDIRKKRKTGL